MSEMIVAEYEGCFPDSRAVLNQRTERMHLFRGPRTAGYAQRCECGSPVDTANTVVFTPGFRMHIEKTYLWCYSCIGNALEVLESEEGA